MFSYDCSLGRANSNSEAVHSATVERFKSETPVYRPSNLRRYLNRPKGDIAEV